MSAPSPAPMQLPSLIEIVRAHPYAALAVALAVGIVLARIRQLPGMMTRASTRFEAYFGGVKLGRLSMLVLGAATLLLVSSSIAEEGFWKTATHETGFAVLVSAVIWTLLEAQLRQETDAVWDRRIEHATRNVFQAVLRKDLPKGLLDEANNLVLNSSLIRSNFAATYTLRDARFAIQPGQETDCVLVDALMEFSMRNVGTDTATWCAAVVLPNPVHPDLKRMVEVRDVAVIKGFDRVELDLASARERFDQDLTGGAGTEVAFRAGDVVLHPGESCSFTASYVMAKEAEDSELLQSLYPADGLRVTIFDHARDDRRLLFAQSIHRRDIVQLSGSHESEHAKIFTVPGYLLPHQGVSIWWKRNPRHNAAGLPGSGSDGRTATT